MLRVIVLCVAFSCAVPSLFVAAQPNEKVKGKVLVKGKDLVTTPTLTALTYWPTPGQLIANEDIVRSLKLDADQDKAVKKAIADHPDAVVAPKGFAELKKNLEASQKLNEALKMALGDKMKRLDQIAVQGAGLPAYFTPAKKAQLDLSDEQLAKGRELIDASIKEMQEKAVKDGRKLTVAMMRLPENRMAFIDTATPKLLTLLSNDQNKKFLDLIGDPLQPEMLLKVRVGTTSPIGIKAPIIKKLEPKD